MMDERLAIVKAIKDYNPENALGWNTLQQSLDSVKFVAFDPVVTSIGITPSGQFSSIAKVLVSVLATGFKGKQIRSSVTVPALVDGVITGQKAEIERMQIRLRDDTGGAAPSTTAYFSAAE